MPSTRSRLVWANAPSKSRMSLEPGERGELVDDGVGPRRGHGGDDRVAVEAVGDDGLGARGAQRRGLRRGAGHARHLVAGGDEERDEAGAERARGAGEEDAHEVPPSAVMASETRWPPRM